MQKPNLLFVLPDQHRPDWLGCNQNLPLRTPNLDGLMRRGMFFANAYTPAPLCSPARACLATGRSYSRCGVVNNSDNTPLSLPTYYQHLRAGGYEVAGAGKFDLHKPDHDWGLDGTHLLSEYGFTRGVDCEGKGDAITSYMRNGMAPKGPYMQFLEQNGLAGKHLQMYEPYVGKPGWLNFPAVTALPEHAYCDNWVAEQALRLLRGFPTGKPWHLVVNFVGPHGPFDVTPAMRARWKDVPFPCPLHNTQPDVDLILARQQNYAAMIENIDMHVGRFLEQVAQRGELGNTIIIYASDHGEMLGDHNRWGKSIWYTPATGIPLIVSGPGVRQDMISDVLVSLHDLSATLLDYARAAPLPEADALSLRPVLEGKAARHRAVLFSGLEDEYGNWRMIYDGRFKLVVGAEESPLLYDLLEDPGETVNAVACHPMVVQDLLARWEARSPSS